jgi:hypothetical protein
MPYESAIQFPRTGTTSPLFVERESDATFVNPGEYFWIKVHSAQAAFRGNIFDQAKQLVITSKVNLNHPALGNEDIFAIQRSRTIDKNRAEQLGLSPNLISLVPATMSHVSVSIDFILDTRNNLAKLGGLINDDKLLAVISLAPGAAAVAKTVGNLAQGLIQSFVPAEERKPILEFAGDFNIGGSNVERGLRSGYYVILGSRHDKDPLPSAVPSITVREDALLIDGLPVTQYSFVVLDVQRIVARTRKLAEGAIWDSKLREAEQMATEFADDPFTSEGEKRETWLKCRALLQEARTLLMADSNYSPDEAADIYKTVYQSCASIIKSASAFEIEGVSQVVDTPEDRLLLDIGQDEDLAAVASDYQEKSEEAERIMVARGVLPPEM